MTNDYETSFAARSVTKKRLLLHRLTLDEIDFFNILQRGGSEQFHGVPEKYLKTGTRVAIIPSKNSDYT